MMNMKALVTDYKVLAKKIESLEKELQEYIDAGCITETQANRKMRWFIFQIASKIIEESVALNMPLPDWKK